MNSGIITTGQKILFRIVNLWKRAVAADEIGADKIRAATLIIAECAEWVFH